LYKAEKYDEAAKYYKKGMELDSMSAANVNGLATVYFKQDKKDESFQTYIQAVKLYQAEKKAKSVKNIFKRLNFLVGKSYTSDNFDQAIEYGEQALEIMPHASIAYYVSRAYLENGENEKALEKATIAVDQGMKDEAVEDKYYIAQAMAYANLGQKAEAIEAYSKVKEGDYYEQAQYQIKQLQG